MIQPSSERARRALALVGALQTRLRSSLEASAQSLGSAAAFEPVSWRRDGGRHGGGTRLQIQDTPVFNRASVNVSGIHYDDLPEKRLASASALSAIVHPRHPQGPSVHTHISFTERRGGLGYWRMMADLNPSHAHAEDTKRFRAALQAAAPAHYEAASAQGDRYFHIPALQRHRGAAHFYLEQFNSGDWEADAALAQRVGEAVIGAYGAILRERLLASGPATAAEEQAQLAYHTLYFFQVLTLDRGTTSGLLVHGQNDVGILGSLPSHVDRLLLRSWRERVPDVQVSLVDALVAALPEGARVLVDVPVKRRLAEAVRQHYAAHPEALALQARGDVIPPTVQNHASRLSQ